MAVSKVLCIELGDTTKIAEVDYQKANPKVYQTAVFDLRESSLGNGADVGVDDDGMIRGKETIATILQSKLTELKFSTKDIIFSIVSTKILSRDVVIPEVKQNRIMEVVNAQASEYFPVETTEYEFAYTMIEKIPAEKSLHIMIYAIQKNIVKSYSTLAEAAKLNLIAIEYGGNALFQVLRKKVEKDTNANVFMEISENSSIVSIIRDGKLDFQRTVSYGVNNIVNKIKDYKTYAGQNDTQLFDLVTKECFIRAHFDEDDLSGIDPTEINDKSVAELEKIDIKDGIADDLRAFVTNVKRMLDSYESKNKNFKPAQCYFFGKGALVRGLIELFTNEMGYKFVVLDDIAGIGIPKNVPANTFIQMYNVLGAGIEPVAFPLTKKENEETQKADLKLYLIALAGAVVVSAAIVAVPYIRLAKQTSLNNDKNAELIQLNNTIGTIYDDYMASNASLVGLQQFDNSSYAYTSVLNDYISQLETSLPSDAVIQSLACNDNKFTLSATVSTKEEVAAFIMQVKKIDTVKTVAVSGITENVDPGTKIVTLSFSVECTMNEPVYDNDAGLMPDSSDTVNNTPTEPEDPNTEVPGSADELPQTTTLAQTETTVAAQ